MNTLEIRSWLVHTTMMHETEVIEWENQTPQQVRDDLYPGVNMAKKGNAPKSIKPGASFKEWWRLEGTQQNPLPQEVWLIELKP